MPDMMIFASAGCAEAGYSGARCGVTGGGAVMLMRRVSENGEAVMVRRQRGGCRECAAMVTAMLRSEGGIQRERERYA